MKKIILAFDSFKGSVSSLEIGRSAWRAIHAVYPDCEVVSLPIADGGEGTVQAICSTLDTYEVTCEATDPYLNPIETTYHITADGTTAIIEMAATSGLPLVEEDRRNPLYTTTYGTGEVVRDALQRGCRRFILGLGGSATNDAGTGMLCALGVHFLNKQGEELATFGKSLIQIAQMDDTHLVEGLRESHFTLICDVNNPFYGADGAAFVFAPQKGATPTDVLTLDAGLRHYAHVLKEQKGMDISGMAGAGAAVGMGGGLLPFLNAELKPGIETILDLVQYREALQGADLVLTGEGFIDAQSLMGKALNGVLKIAQEQHVPVIALCGGAEHVSQLNEMGFTSIFSIQPSPVTMEQAMEKEFTLENIERTTLQLMRTIRQFSGK